MLSVKKPFEGADTPLSPLSPFSPCGPWMPWEPWMPCLPWGPVAPCGPVGPCGPVEPVGPCGPAAPIAPASPLSPFSPRIPCSPCGPSGPATPLRPSLPDRSFLSPEDRWVRSLRWPPVVLRRLVALSLRPGRFEPNQFVAAAPVSDALACAPGASVSTEPIFRPVM